MRKFLLAAALATGIAAAAPAQAGCFAGAYIGPLWGGLCWNSGPPSYQPTPRYYAQPPAQNYGTQYQRAPYQQQTFAPRDGGRHCSVWWERVWGGSIRHRHCKWSWHSESHVRHYERYWQSDDYDDDP